MIVEAVHSQDDIRHAIRRALVAERKTQRQLAQHLGMTEKHVSYMMTGRNNISIDVLFDIIRFLDLELALI